MTCNRLSCFAVILFCSTLLSFPSLAAIQAEDDSGTHVVLEKPARRIISLAPHVTELLYAAGAGAHLVGAAEYSDYPEAAKNLPRVGGGAGMDLETIVTLNPDLIVAWKSGNPAWQIERLRELGIPVYVTEPRQFLDLPRHMEQLGRLAGTPQAAMLASRQFRRDYNIIRNRYARRPPLKVFYQLLDTSLMTVNGEHLISQALRLCGGHNIFSGLPRLAVTVDAEAVWRADPDVIIAGGTEGMWREWRARWRRWPHLAAVRKEAMYFIPGDLLHRHSPRILQGVRQVCLALDQARAKRRLRDAGTFQSH